MSAYEVDAATMCDALSHVEGVEHVVLEFDERGDGVLRVQVSGDLDHASVLGAAVHQMRHRFGLGIEHQRLKLTGPAGRPVVAVVETMAAPDDEQGAAPLFDTEPTDSELFDAEPDQEPATLYDELQRMVARQELQEAAASVEAAAAPEPADLPPTDLQPADRQPTDLQPAEPAPAASGYEDTVPGISMDEVRADMARDELVRGQRLPDFWPELTADPELRNAIDDVFDGVGPETFERRTARHRAVPKQPADRRSGSVAEAPPQREERAASEPARPKRLEPEAFVPPASALPAPVTEPEPAVEPAAQPADEMVIERVVELVIEPAVEPVVEHAVERVVEPEIDEKVDEKVDDKVDTESADPGQPQHEAEPRRSAAPYPESPRVVVERMVVTSEHNEVVASVHLRSGDTVHEGCATRPATGSGAHRALAAATAAAVEQVVPGPARLEVDQVDMLQVGHDHVAVVVLSLLGPAGIDRLTGSALVRGDAQDAVVRATLDALNRRAGLGGDRGGPA